MFRKIVTSSWFWLFVILIFAFWVRTYRIDRALADWHSWRQADTAAVSRNFIWEGFNVLEPKYDDMVPVAEGSLPNLNRYRYVEFPIYNIIVSALWLVFGIQLKIARLVSIFFSLGSIIFLYLITKKYLGLFLAFLSTLVFAFLPYNIFYSTVIMPEPMLIFTMVGTLYFFDLWLAKNNPMQKNIIFGSLSLLFSATGLLLKPTFIFLAFPLLYLAWKNLGWGLFKNTKVWLFVFFTLVPFAVWRIISLQHPEGIPRWTWLLNGTKIRFKAAFFYWIIQERLSRLILTVPGVALFILGILAPLGRRMILFYAWLMSLVIYLFIFATGNVTHDYYQVILIPILSIFVAVGIWWLLTWRGDLSRRIFGWMMAVILVILMSGLGWREGRDLFAIRDPNIVEAGEAADRLLPKDAKVIAPYGGSTAFLYQTKRHGWAIGVLPIPEMKEKLGATHYVTVKFDSEAADLEKEYKTLLKTDKFLIIDLTQPKT
jgi:hypothetical protein